MSYYVVLHPGSLAVRSEKYSSETLRRIGRQVEALLSQHSSLEIYRRSVQWQLGLIAEQMQEDDVLLVPCRVFHLLETRGDTEVSAHLEQIARILREAGYWQREAREQDYHRLDVYQLGKSAQKLFDDCAALDRQVRQLQGGLIS